MRYFIFGLISFFSLGSVLSFNIPSSYIPTAADQALVQGLQPKIDILYKQDYKKMTKIKNKLQTISELFSTHTREYYVLRELFVYMNQLLFVNENQVMNTRSASTDNKVTPTNTHSSGSYAQYSDTALSTALANNKRVILNFRASWCPNCTASSNNIIANVTLLPNDVVILEADYDTEIALKAKYGVTRQTTYVFLDKQGNSNKILQNINGIDDLLEDL